MELHPSFDIRALEARLSDEVINETMDDVERERKSSQRAAGPSGGDPTIDTRMSAEPMDVIKIKSADED